MEEDSTECCGHGCLLLFPAESLSAWQCPTSSGFNSKLNVVNSFSRCCGSERREAYKPQNNCRSAGNAGPYISTTVAVWPLHKAGCFYKHSCSSMGPFL